MIQIIKELKIEVSKPNIIQAIVAKQYDMNTRFLKVTLVDCGNTITISPSATKKVVINAERPDGQSKGFEGVINDDGTVTVPLHSWMLELDGTVICDISVIDTAVNDNMKLTTTSFTLLVEKAAYGGSDITSDPQYDVLVNLINEVDPLSQRTYVNNNFAGAIRNTVSGDVIKVSDVSPIEHELEVKVKSGNKFENYVDFSTIASVDAGYEEYYTIEVVDDVIIVTPKSHNLDLINLPALNVLCPNIPSDTKATFYFEVETEETAIKNNAYIATPAKDIYQGIETLIEYPWSDYSTGYAKTYLYFGTSVTKPLKIKNLKIGIPTDEPAIEDLTTVSVTAQGKNILPFPYVNASEWQSGGITYTVNNDGSVHAKGTTTGTSVFRLATDGVDLKDGVSYVVSCGHLTRKIYVTYNDGSGQSDSYWGNLNNAAPLVWKKEYKLKSVNIQYLSAGSYIDEVIYPQIEVGEVATEYEPYVEPFTVSANADETVKGLMSISPSMTLMTDTADVTIDLAYNADTKMYIDNKFNELATALLNA